MKWNKYTLTTTTEAVDLISYTLNEMGIEGIEIEDKIPLTDEKRQMFIDILPDLGPDDGVAYVSFYIEPEDDKPETIKEVLDAVHELKDFVDIGQATIVKTQTADEDWMNNWKNTGNHLRWTKKYGLSRHGRQFRQSKKMSLLSSLTRASFGTGMHHTTRLCITQLKKYLKPEYKLFDVGCGSGILSIIGLLLGDWRQRQQMWMLMRWMLQLRMPV